MRRGSWGRQILTDYSVELIQDVDGLRRERRNSSQRRMKKLTVSLFIEKAVNDACVPKIVLRAQKTAVNEAIKNHFPLGLHFIKISKLSGLFHDDKSCGGKIKQKR